ncbi:MAG: hypothetical protein AABX91_00170, partial [Nanoarchaeota archaeon]
NESYLKDYGDTATGNYTFDLGTLFIGSDTDKVGIGKLAPTTTLDVNGTINASQMTVNGTAVLTSATWNATNASYALNQTLTDMWTPFLSTTNSSYLMIDKFNVTNASYRTITNVTFVGNVTTTSDFCIAGGACLSAPASGGNSSWNQTYASGELYFLKSQWNVTNASYALNQTLTDMWTPFLSTTNSSYLMIDRFNVTNTSYLMADRWNATNTSYRTLTNLTFIGDILFNLTGSNNDFSIINSTSNASLLFINGTFGRVGIGTLTPMQTLNVFGDANATGTVYTDSSLNLTKVYVWVTNSTFAPIGEPKAFNGTLMRIDQWNATNTSYRTLTNITFVGNLSTTSDFCISGGNCLSASGGDNSSWNQTYATSNLYFLKSQWNVTNASYLMIDKWNATNTSYRTLINYTFLGNVNISDSNLSVTQNVTGSWFVGFINASNVLNAPWSTGGSDNSSWNQSYSKTVNDLLYAVLGSGNTSLQMFQAVDNGTFRKLNNFTFLGTGNFTDNVSTTFFLGDGRFLTNLPAGTEVDPKWTINFTNSESAWLNTTNLTYLMIDRFNVTNVSYYLATNPFGFYNSTNPSPVTNTSYLMVDKFNVTNTSYRTLTNLTFIGDILFNLTGSNNDFSIINSTSNASLLFINGTFGRVGIGTLTPMQTLNVFGDANATGTVYTDSSLNLTKVYVWVTNGTFLQSGAETDPKWTANITGFYRLNATQIMGIINATHIPAFTINATHIGNSVINSSHILAGSINASRILAGEINSSHTSAEFNNSYRGLRNGTFTQQTNMTTFNITFSGSNSANITSNLTCISIWGPTAILEIC